MRLLHRHHGRRGRSLPQGRRHGDYPLPALLPSGSPIRRGSRRTVAPTPAPAPAPEVARLQVANPPRSLPPGPAKATALTALQHLCLAALAQTLASALLFLHCLAPALALASTPAPALALLVVWVEVPPSASLLLAPLPALTPALVLALERGLVHWTPPAPA